MSLKTPSDHWRQRILYSLRQDQLKDLQFALRHQLLPRLVIRNLWVFRLQSSFCSVVSHSKSHHHGDQWLLFTAKPSPVPWALLEWKGVEVFPELARYSGPSSNQFCFVLSILSFNLMELCPSSPGSRLEYWKDRIKVWGSTWCDPLVSFKNYNFRGVMAQAWLKQVLYQLLLAEVGWAGVS